MLLPSLQLTWLIDSAVKGGFILALAFAASLCLHKAPSALRHLLWVVALTMAGLMPVLSAALPAWRIMPPPRHRAMTVSSPRISTPAVDLPLYFQSDDPRQEHVQQRADAAKAPPVTAKEPPSEGSRRRVTWPELLLLAWLSGLAAMMTPTLLAIFSIRRLMRRSERVTDPALLADIVNAMNDMGVNQAVSLLQSRDCQIPMTWGIARCRILLPKTASQWPAQRRRAVLLHELAHIRRFDCATHLLAQVVRALHWFNPLSWWAVRQMEAERELACDDAVVGAGVLPSLYAEQLLATVLSSFNRFPIGGIAMARTSKIKNRLTAICDTGRNRTRMTWRQASILVSAFALGAIPLAMIAPSIRAEAPTPAGQIAEHKAAPTFDAGTFAVLRVDLRKLDTAEFSRTVKSLVGEHFPLDEATGAYGGMRDSFISAHVDTIYLGFNHPVGGPNSDPIAYLQLADGADDNAARAAWAKLNGPNAPAHFQRDGNYLIVRVMNGPIVRSDANAQDALVKGLNIGGDAPVAVAFVSTPQLAAGAEMSPAAIKQSLTTILRDTKYASLAFTPGEAAHGMVRANAADAAGADRLVKAGSDLLSQAVDALTQPAGDVDFLPADARTSMIKALRAIKPAARDTEASISLDHETLGPLVQGFLIARRGAAQSAQTMNQVQQLLIGVITYSANHDGKLPDKLEDLKDMMGGDDAFKKLMTDPKTGAIPAFIYVKPAEKMSQINTSNTKIIFEMKEGRKADSGIIGFADGHVEIVRPASK
jgi:beta-lactamase regulating signal transducer with metallopeptidase domain